MGEAMANAGPRERGFRKLLDALSSGTGIQEAIAEARAYVDDARPEDLVAVVDAAVADGVEFAALKPAVSKLVNLLSAPLSAHRYRAREGERLFSSLLAENRGLLAALEDGKAAARALNDAAARGDAAGTELAMARLGDLAARLGAIDIHYKKKENVLFPFFEARWPQYRCVRLMWEIQDDARRGLRELGTLLGMPAADAGTGLDLAAINRCLGRLYFDLNANVTREECALFPVMAPLMDPADADRLFLETAEYGFAFLDGETARGFMRTEAGHRGDATASQAAAAGAGTAAAAQAGFMGRTGALSPDALAAIFGTIPLDMTFVDADDKVRWFSDSPHRIFARSPAIVGRDVRNCHPGASVGRVVAILDSFKAGAKEREAFWLTMGGRFIHIEYFALRAPDGSYLGTLECSQDLTGLRALSGEKRLAD